VDLNAGMPGQPAPGLCSGAGMQISDFQQSFSGWEREGGFGGNSLRKELTMPRSKPPNPGNSGRRQSGWSGARAGPSRRSPGSLASPTGP
jgi:hypothetical protein